MIGFEALAIIVSAIGVGSRKEEKAKRLSELEEILLGYCIRLRLEIKSYAYISDRTVAV